MPAPDATVRHDSAQNAFLLLIDGEERGRLDYRRSEENVWSLTHTEVDPAFQNQGLAARLVSEALDEIRADNGRIRPLCPYIPAFLRRHPEYADLVATQ